MILRCPISSPGRAIFWWFLLSVAFVQHFAKAKTVQDQKRRDFRHVLVGGVENSATMGDIPRRSTIMILQFGIFS